MANASPLIAQHPMTTRYRLRDGSIGTEVEAIDEDLLLWELKKHEAIAQIRQLTQRRKTARTT